MNEEVGKTPGSSIASLVLGLISLLCAWFGYGALISIITGIIGIILGIKGNKIQQTGMGTAESFFRLSDSFYPLLFSSLVSCVSAD